MSGAWAGRLAAATAVAVILALAAPVSASPAQREFFARSGEAAASYRLPPDVRLITRFDLPAYEVTYERYQQVFGGRSAKVFGAQVTVLRDRAGAARLVVGAHYEGLTSQNSVQITPDQARVAPQRDTGDNGTRQTELLFDPQRNRYVYRVETQLPTSRWFHFVDAQTGGVIRRIHAEEGTCSTAPCGLGAGYDRDPTDIKILTGLTTRATSRKTTSFQLRSVDGRQETRDNRNRSRLGAIATDSDDRWVTLGSSSPGQQALVDAQHYARVADDYWRNTHTYDWVARAKAFNSNIVSMKSAVHVNANWNNATWNGQYASFGDGDQTSFEEFTPLDVVGHEFAHGLTDFTSNLVYSGESGALNEAFSDISGTAMEFYAEPKGAEPALSRDPDWELAEDLDISGDIVAGFRNMADPEEDGDPDHYTERVTDPNYDNGGVHINSALANHAFFLLTNGGMNASCATPTGHKATHCFDSADGQDNNVVVPALGLSAAEKIFFLGMTTLTENSTFCDARSSTEAAADRFGADAATATTAAWVAVGLTDAVCPRTTP